MRQQDLYKTNMNWINFNPLFCDAPGSQGSAPGNEILFYIMPLPACPSSLDSMVIDNIGTFE